MREAFAISLLSTSVQHFSFALQYLRSSLTVPLYFERREKIDSNRDDLVAELNKKIKQRSRFIFIS